MEMDNAVNKFDSEEIEIKSECLSLSLGSQVNIDEGENPVVSSTTKVHVDQNGEFQKIRKRGRPKRQNLKPTRFGHCGNQLGEELFTLAFNDNIDSYSSYYNNTCNRDSWFHHTCNGKIKARAVLVDSDSQVVSNMSHITKTSSPWTFSPGNLVFRNDGGAGKNFAKGYSVTGPQLEDDVLEVLRKECERCDRVTSIISLGSFAGGTGSGVGSYILEHIKDSSYIHKNLISVLVMPYFSGEVFTQSINILFTLSKQTDICDAVVVFENDVISSLAVQQSKNYNLPDLNKIISQNLLSFLQPVNNNNHSIDLYEFLSYLCPHPSYKYLSIQSFPLIKQSKNRFDTSPSWNSIERDMIRFLKSSFYTANVDFINAVANVVISRGQLVPNSTVAKLKSVFLYPDWMPTDCRFYQYHQPQEFLKQDKCLSVITNSFRICGLIDSCVKKSQKQFINNMFVHHFYKFGFTKDDFLESFAKNEQILKAYRNLQ